MHIHINIYVSNYCINFVSSFSHKINAVAFQTHLMAPTSK